jgi:hypothetical protein
MRSVSENASESQEAVFTWFSIHSVKYQDSVMFIVLHFSYLNLKNYRREQNIAGH